MPDNARGRIVSIVAFVLLSFTAGFFVGRESVYAQLRTLFAFPVASNVRPWGAANENANPFRVHVNDVRRRGPGGLPSRIRCPHCGGKAPINWLDRFLKPNLICPYCDGEGQIDVANLDRPVISVSDDYPSDYLH